MDHDSGNSVLVTGAASGIGAACASVLAAKGTRLVLTDIAEPLGALPEGNVEWVQGDVTMAEDRARILECARSLSGVVHCAGILRFASPATLSPDTWDLVINVNLTSTFRLIQEALPRLVDHAGIVLMSSVAAKWAATPEAIAYAASKAGVLSLTRSFAAHLAPRRIRVNAICPGIIDTPMNKALLETIAKARNIDVEQLERQRMGTIPLGRMGRPEDIADVAAFLLSAGASYMTGQSINVSGGMVTH